MGYWLSDNFISVFSKGTLLSNIAVAKQGLATSDNNRFTRLWFEPNINNIYFSATDFINALYTGLKWFPYNKGGDFRRWYGNNEYVVNWKDNGKEIRNVTGANGKIASRAQNTEYYFRSSITWSKIGSGKISFRYKPCGHIFDVAGTSIFTESTDEQLYLAGLLNTNTIQYLLKIMSLTLNYDVGQISNIPIIDSCKEYVIKKVQENISISKKDLDEFETSWDFKKHPLI